MNGVVNSFRVSAAGGQLMVADKGMMQRVTVGVAAFFRSLPRLPSSRAIDLLVIAIGAYAADRMVLRHGRQSAGGGVRNFDIAFEVQDPSFWSQEDVRESVIDVLSFLTDDNWSVSFDQSTENWYQAILPIRWFNPTRIALFSEGLDSVAGLAAWALSRNDQLLLVTVGHYATLRRRTERQIARLVELVPNLSARQSSLLVSLRGGVARRLGLQEKTQRSRAFLFCATAVVAAAACELRDIDIYENGVGAVNLPLMTGMLFSGLATRGAHPSLLTKMSVLGSLVVGETLAFKLPHEDLTKGEMVARLSGRGFDHWLQQSRSCIHTSPRIAGMPQCGACPACIERRLAFAIAGIQEEPGRYQIDVFRDQLSDKEYMYFNAFIEQSTAFLSNDPMVLRRLQAHLRGTGVDVKEYERIHRLFRRNADEVLRIFTSVRRRLVETNGAAIDGDSSPLESIEVA